MITQIEKEINGRHFIETSSDEFYIRQVQTGIIYAIALDIAPCTFTYEETDDPLPQPEPE